MLRQNQLLHPDRPVIITAEFDIIIRTLRMLHSLLQRTTSYVSDQWIVSASAPLSLWRLFVPPTEENFSHTDISVYCNIHMAKNVHLFDAGHWNRMEIIDDGQKVHWDDDNIHRENKLHLLMITARWLSRWSHSDERIQEYFLHSGEFSKLFSLLRKKM